MATAPADGWIRAVAMVSAAALVFGALPVCAEPDSDLPKNYELVERTLSPDGRFGMLFPRRHDTDETYPPNLLVRLRPYKVLAEISPGLPDGATTDLGVTWSGNQTVAIHHFRRWGLVNLWVYDLADERVIRRQDVMGPAREIFLRDLRKRLLARFPDEPETVILVSDEGEEEPATEYAFEGRRLRLNLRADNKPNLAGGPHWSATLKATWDLDHERFRDVKLTPGPVEVRPNP